MFSWIKSHTNNIALGIFISWCLVILTAILAIHPGWGFMDDHNNLTSSLNFWQHPSFERLQRMIVEDTGSGRFRPIYMLWIITVYKIGANAPYLIYFFTTLTGLLVLPLWGLILDKVFNHGKKSPFLVWIYPLAFSLFTPFWNLFMYISIQEKFIYLFSGPAILFFLRSYEKNCWKDFVISLVFACLATLSKETGIVLVISFSAYAFFDAIIFKRNPPLSLKIWGIATTLFTSYYFFIQQLLKSYTARYANNSNFHATITNLFSSPLHIKLALILSLIVILWQIGHKLTNRKFEENGESILAWLTSFYILILLPWGFQSYILAPLSAFVIGMGFFFFRLGDKYFLFKIFKRLIIIVLIFITAFFIIIPQIQKMADKHKVAKAVEAISKKDPSAIFFYPPPYAETATALSIFSQSQIIYVNEGGLSRKDIATGKTPYLLINDECSPAKLLNLSPGQQIYASETWRIYTLKFSTKERSSFKPVFDRNFLQTLKDYIKKT